MENIILIGMPAVGKSTIGVVVAKHLGYDFIDSDLLIQRQENRVLRRIIADEGIDKFLEIENQVNKSINAVEAVISPGGSVIYCEDAMEHFNKIGVIVYLQASYETIANRIKDTVNRGVVLKQGQTFRDLYDERVELFEKYAHITLSEDGLSLDETIEGVIRAVEK